MSARPVDPSTDPIEPAPSDEVTIEVDGKEVKGIRGQTIAAVMLTGGVPSWGRTPVGERPRGLFCGIGVCFECVAVVNGLADVRVCQRRAENGDVVAFDHRPLDQRETPSSEPS